MVDVVQTTRAPATAASLAVSKAVSNQGTGTSATATLAAASDPSNRGIAYVVENATGATFTPETNWNEVSGSAESITGPTLRARILFNSTAFDTSPSGSYSASLGWCMVATELEQG
jgi:hypothetical protein